MRDRLRLKPAQQKKLRSIALDGRRRPADRRWAATCLSEHGIDVGVDIPGYATPGEGRQAPLEAEGGCVTVPEAIKRFRKPTLIEQIKKRNVIVYRGGRLESSLVPIWQFAAKGGILRGLPAVLKVLRKVPGAGQLAPFTFFLQPEPMLEMRTPLEALRNGEVRRVLEAAIEHVRFYGGIPKEWLREIPPAQLRAVLIARGEAAKPLIEERSGRSFSSAEVAARFGVTAGTVRSSVAADRCVGYRDVRKRLRLPAWQFSGSKRTYPWVAPLLKAYGGNGWAFLDFVTTPRRRIADTPVDKESLLHRAQAGDVELALEAARRANPD